MTTSPSPRSTFTTAFLPLSELYGDPRNPKAHNLELIDSSMERFGIVDRITRDDRTGQLISGHGRANALRKMESSGAEPPEGVEVDPDTGVWLVPVNVGWASRNDTEAAAALIAMNRTTEIGGWVDDALLDLLDSISESGAGFEGVGFTETDLEDLRASLENFADEWKEDEDDEEPPVKGSGGGAMVTIKLLDPGAIEIWHATRDLVKSDDAAARIFFGLDERPTAADPAAKKTRKRRSAPEPTLDDITIEIDLTES